MRQARAQLLDWLTGFQACVRTLDFERGRTMFLPKLQCFGSHATRMTTLDTLVRRQWKQVWPNITGFTFDLEKLDIVLDARRTWACLMLPWTSTGYANGTPFKRPGRVTILLRWDGRRRRWMAYHTHYSLNPGTPQSTSRRAARR